MADYGQLSVGVVADTSAMASTIARDATRAGQQAGKSIENGVKTSAGSVGQQVGLKIAGDIGYGIGAGTRLIGQGVGKGFQLLVSGAVKAGGAVVDSLAAVGRTATTAGVAVAGIGLAKGFSRLVAIDEARFKLQGLGHDAATVDTIMTNALNSVRGTAFGMGDAASLAATLVASGIKPGQELERTLKLTADAATIAGTDLADMGDIFARVAAGGKLTGQELNRLTARGIPAVQMLAKSMGVSEEQVRKLVSAGKVGFPEFQAAIEQGMGGAALASGNTFRGALANVQAALGRLGAEVLGPAFGQMAPLFQQLIGQIDKLGPAAKRVGQVIGSSLSTVVQRITDLLGRVDFAAVFDKARSALAPLSSMAAPIAALFGAKGLGAVSGLLGPFGKLLPAINPVVAAVAALVATSPELRSAFGGMLASLKPIIPIVAQVAQIVGQVLTQAFAQLVPFIARLVPVIGQAAQILGGLLLAAFTALAPIIPTVVRALTTVLDAVVPLLPVVAQLAATVVGVLAAALSAVAPLLLPLAQLIGQVFAAISPLLPVITQLAQTIGVLLGAALQIVVPILRLLIAALSAVITVVGPLIAALAGGLNTALAGVADGVGRTAAAVSSAFNTIRSVISSAVSAVTGAVQSGFNAVSAAISAAMNTARSVVSSAWQSVQAVFNAGVNAVVGAARGVAGAVGAALSGVVNAMTAPFRAAWSAIQNIINTIKSAVTAVGNTVSSGIGAAKSLFNGFANVWNSIHITLPSVKIPLGPTLGGNTIGLPHIPTLQAGGVVEPVPGGVLAILAEAGHPERISPLDASGMTAAERDQADLLRHAVRLLTAAPTRVVNVYPRADQSELDIAAAVDRQFGWLAAGA